MTNGAPGSPARRRRLRPQQSRALTAITVVASLILSLVAVTLAPTLPAGAAASTDPATQRENVRQQKAAVAGKIDALNATSDEVNQALDAVDENVRGTQAQANDAQRAADAAQAQADAAQRDADAAQATIDKLRGQVAAAAVEAYVHPPGDRVMDLFQQADANEAATKSALLDVANGNKLDVVDEYRAAQHELEVKRDEASKAQAQAADRASALQDKVASYQQARDQQAALAAQVNSRIDDALAESDSLSKLDASLSAQIAADQAKLITKVQKVAPTGGSGGGSGGGGGGGGGGVVVTGPGSLTTVYGITVASSIAGQLSSLIQAAAAAGFTLGGGGYRDSSAQIALRKAHCGTSDYAIYEMPASQCHPPTAPPGSSMHEKGLAVDFTANGKLLARGDAAFAWMQGHAGSYGFINLPSEPWHWSTNGN